MADFEWPADLVPYAQSFYLQPHVGGTESPFGRQRKTYELSAPRWVTRMTFRGGYDGTSGAEAYGPRLDALIARLKAGVSTIAIGDFRRPAVRSLDAPIANLSAAAGDTELLVHGFTPSGTGLRAGDYFEGDGRTHIVREDAPANASGVAAVSFEPPLRSALAAGEARFDKAESTFRLVGEDAGDNMVEVGQAVGYSLEFTEELNPVDTATARSRMAGEAEGFEFSFTTENLSRGVYVRDLTTPANDFEGSVEDWFAGEAWPSREVVNQAGATVMTADGELPWDWSSGTRELKLVGAELVMLQSSLPEMQSLLIQGRPVATSAVAGTSFAGIGPASGTEYLADYRLQDTLSETENVLRASRDDLLTLSDTLGRLGDLSRDRLVSIAQSYRESVSGTWEISTSLNGLLASRETLLNKLPDYDRLTLGGAGVNFYLRRVAGRPRHMSDNELHLWGDGADYHPSLLGSWMMGQHAGDTDTATQRMPHIVDMGQSGEVQRLLGFHHQKHAITDTTTEDPMRLKEQYLEWSASGWSSPTDQSFVSWQPAGWSTNQGSAYGPMTIRRSYGPRAGRLIQIFEQRLGAPGGSASIMIRTRDGLSGAWSTPEVLLPPTDFGDGQGVEVIATGSAGLGIEFPADSAWPNRIAFPIYTFTAGVGRARILYSDDDFETWDVSNFVESPDPAYSINETALALTAAGAIVATHRADTSGGLPTTDLRYFSTSGDGGETLTFQGEIPDVKATSSAGAMFQLDPEGALSPFGRILFVTGWISAGIDRNGIVASYFEDVGMTPRDEHWLVPRYRRASYVGAFVARVGSQWVLFLAVEVPIRGHNNHTASGVMAFRAQARGVRTAPGAAVPTISGTPEVGETLTANGTWGPYQWQRNGADIAGATGKTYAVDWADAGKMLAVIAGGMESAGVEVAVPVVTISGSAVVGETLTSFGGLSGPFQWQRDGVDIAGANSSTYQLEEEDIGAMISLIVGPAVGGVISNSLGPVAAFDPVSLFASGETGFWYDPSDLATLYSDTAGTTAAVVDGPVGKMLDKSGNGNHAVAYADAQRPTLRQASDGRYYLEFTRGVGAMRNGAAQAQPFTRLTGLRQVAWNSSDYIYGAADGLTRVIQTTASPILTPFAGTSLGGMSRLQVGDDGVFQEVWNGASSGYDVDRHPLTPYNFGSAGVNELLIGRRNTVAHQGAAWRFSGAIQVGRVLTWLERDNSRAYLRSKTPTTSTVRHIVTFGDSKTFGAGSTAGGGAYPLRLQQLLGNGWQVHNQGISQQTSDSIAMRAGAIDCTVALAGNTLPASGAVAVTIVSPARGTAQASGPLSWTSSDVRVATIVTNDGTEVLGEFRSIGIGSYTFTRYVNGDAKAVSSGTPMAIYQHTRWQQYAVWMAGRNNLDETRVLDDAIAFVESRPPGFPHPLILGLWNAANGTEDTGSTNLNHILARNAALSAEFGSNFIDVRDVFRRDVSDPTSGRALAGIAAGPNDAADIAAGRPPRSLLGTDLLHGGDAGYLAIAHMVNNHMIANGWKA